MGGEEDYESFSGNDDNGLTSLRYGRLDRLSSCLFLMACVITRARLDSIAILVREVCALIETPSPRSQRPLPAIFFLGLCTAASIHSLGRSARKHPSCITPAARWTISSSHQATRRLLCVRYPSIVSIESFMVQSPTSRDKKADLASFGRSIPCGEEPAAHTMLAADKGTVR
jgi:hypothetical protein